MIAFLQHPLVTRIEGEAAELLVFCRGFDGIRSSPSVTVTSVGAMFSIEESPASPQPDPQRIAPVPIIDLSAAHTIVKPAVEQRTPAEPTPVESGYAATPEPEIVVAEIPTAAADPVAEPEATPAKVDRRRLPRAEQIATRPTSAAPAPVVAPRHIQSDFGTAYSPLNAPKYMQAISEGINARPESGEFWVVKHPLSGYPIMSLTPPTEPERMIQRVYRQGREWVSRRLGGEIKVMGRDQDDVSVAVPSSLSGKVVEGGKR